jgi:hypothetical protein
MKQIYFVALTEQSNVIAIIPFNGHISTFNDKIKTALSEHYDNNDIEFKEIESETIDILYTYEFELSIKVIDEDNEGYDELISFVKTELY